MTKVALTPIPAEGYRNRMIRLFNRIASSASCFVALAALMPLFVTGCAGLKSRYAMDNPEYAEKYAEGAEKSDVLGKLKQASDARFVEGAHGAYIGGGALVAPQSGEWLATLNTGVEDYPTSFSSTRIGGEMIVADGLYAGADAGLRLQPPSRLAPFVGVGGTAGVSVGDLALFALYTAIDDPDEEEQCPCDDDDDDIQWDGFAAVYPEVGAHFWTNGSLRMTAFGRYMITTEGRSNDGWLLGMQIAGF